MNVRNKMGNGTAQATPTIKAVLTDVDGTLVTRDKVLTPRAMAAVHELQDRGVLFAITSGRPPRGMRMLVEPLRMNGPMAAFNGGMIVLPDMTIVDERTMSEEVARAVIEEIWAHGLYAWFYRGTDWYLTDPHAPHAEREASTVQFPPTVVPTYDGLLDNVVKIVGVSDNHPLVEECEAAVQKKFGAQVSAARSQPHYLDVTNPTANKGVVAERLSNYYHIPLENLCTLGDQANDVLMFKKSGLSVAMGNSSDEVKRQADFVTTSFMDEGFANAIDQYILPRVAPAGALARAE
jgi:Cof subfamily protein (haloacid dehalogenase superfamily)